MKYLIAIVLAVSLSLGVAILPSFADSGVSVTLTTTVTGGGTEYPGFDSSPSSGKTKTWQELFPGWGDEREESYGSPDNRVIQNNPPIPIPPVVSQQNVYTPLPTPVQEPRDDSKDMYVYIFIGLAALLIGLILYLIIPDQKVR